QVTSISTGADGAIWSPDGKNIVFVSAVHPYCKNDACNKQRDEERKKSKLKAKMFTRLFYRQCNSFTEFKRTHLFVVCAETNSNGPGRDTTSLYSPDGKYLAWRSQARAGFEADKWRLLVQDRQTGKTHDVTNRFDRSVGSFTWHRPMKFDSGAGVQHLTGILFTAEDHGESPIYNCDAESTDAVPTTDGARLHCDDLVCNGTDNLYFTRQSIGAPNEIWLQVLTEPEPKQITHMNDALLSTIDMQP